MPRYVQDLLTAILGLGPEVQSKLLASAVGLLVLILLRSLAVRLVNRRIDDAKTLYGWRKGITYATFLLALLVVARPWFPALGDISTFLGIVTAGLAVALRDPIVNLAGWVFILGRRPFQVGDRIQIGEHRGDVIDVRVFQFTLLEIGNWVDADQSTGRIIHVPNGLVFTLPLANYARAFEYIWSEVPVLLTFESNWRKAKEILARIGERHAEHLSPDADERLRRAAQRYMIFYSKLGPTVYTTVRDSGVLLTVRFLCEPRRRRAAEQGLWEDILTEFAQCDDIDFAYPTQRFFDNASEGKRGARAAE
jgi:small-conductance mechanosensitive channel